MHFRLDWCISSSIGAFVIVSNQKVLEFPSRELSWLNLNASATRNMNIFTVLLLPTLISAAKIVEYAGSALNHYIDPTQTIEKDYPKLLKDELDRLNNGLGYQYAFTEDDKKDLHFIIARIGEVPSNLNAEAMSLLKPHYLIARIQTEYKGKTLNELAMMVEMQHGNDLLKPDDIKGFCLKVLTQLVLLNSKVEFPRVVPPPNSKDRFTVDPRIDFEDQEKAINVGYKKNANLKEDLMNELAEQKNRWIQSVLERLSKGFTDLKKDLHLSNWFEMKSAIWSDFDKTVISLALMEDHSYTLAYEQFRFVNKSFSDWISDQKSDLIRSKKFIDLYLTKGFKAIRKCFYNVTRTVSGVEKDVREMRNNGDVKRLQVQAIKEMISTKANYWEQEISKAKSCMEQTKQELMDRVSYVEKEMKRHDSLVEKRHEACKKSLNSIESHFDNHWADAYFKSTRRGTKQVPAKPENLLEGIKTKLAMAKCQKINAQERDVALSSINNLLTNIKNYPLLAEIKGEIETSVGAKPSDQQCTEWISRIKDFITHCKWQGQSAQAILFKLNAEIKTVEAALAPKATKTSDFDALFGEDE